MRAFHNDPAIKKKYVARVRAHEIADEIVKGKYWEEGKGCAVGCTIHSGKHNSYESELGIPEWLAFLEDSIFEGMSNEKAKKWPLAFLEAIPVGADLEKVKAPFLIFVLKSALLRFDHNKFPDVKNVIDRVIGLYENEETDLGKFREAAEAAEAARAAWVRDVTEAAARAAAWAARAAAWAAEAARAAWERDVAWAAEAAARTAEFSAEYDKFATELLRLLEGCR